MEFVGSTTRDVNEANLARGQLGTRPRPERVRPRPRPRPRPKKFFEAEAKMYEAEAKARYSRNINHYIGTNCHKRSIISANVLTK